MNLTIGQIIREFSTNPFWRIGLVTPPDERKLAAFFQEHPFPKDFQTLLSYSDGFVLFQAGDYQISSLEWILSCKYDPKYKSYLRDEFWKIGYFMGYNLVIDETKSNTNQYLFVGDAYVLDDYIKLGTVTDFFNDFIDSKGEIPFWKTEGVEKYNLGT